MCQVFLALLSSSEPSFEYSITGEQLLIYVLHDQSTYTYLWFGMQSTPCLCRQFVAILLVKLPEDFHFCVFFSTFL
jgi:hypothetical protein